MAAIRLTNVWPPAGALSSSIPENPKSATTSAYERRGDLFSAAEGSPAFLLLVSPIKKKQMLPQNRLS
jgi:hypothetical protein